MGVYNVADRFMKVYNRIVKRSNDQYENKVTLQIIDNTSKDKKNDLLTFIGESKQMVLNKKVEYNQWIIIELLKFLNLEH